VAKVRFLAEHKADVNIADMHNDTPLHHLARVQLQGVTESELEEVHIYIKSFFI